MSPMPKKLQFTDDQRAWFRQQGVKHGAEGGKTAAANMTKAERRARAVKAAKAATRARRAKARQAASRAVGR